jgi:hypothetical protein
MTTFPFVLRYSLERVDLTAAEDLLAQYNDFYVYNLAQYQNYAQLKVDDSGELSNATEELGQDEIAQLEKQGNDNAGVFAKVWGSLDFASATLMGLEIDWQIIQVSLLEEQRRKIPAIESGMNEAGNKLRNVASVLSFADKIVTDLTAKNTESGMVTLIKQGFELLLNELSARDIKIPEYNIEKPKYLKIKTADGIIDFAQKLFELGK